MNITDLCYIVKILRTLNHSSVSDLVLSFMYWTLHIKLGR